MGRRRDLDELIDEITVDCYGDDEELVGFLTSIEEELSDPMAATVVGTPVELLAVDYHGDPRRGLVATCRRQDATYVVSALDVHVADGERLGDLLDAYRYWSSPAAGLGQQ